MEPKEPTGWGSYMNPDELITLSGTQAQPNIYVSEYLSEEPFYNDLQGLGFDLVPFGKEDKDWLHGKKLGVYLIHEKLLINEFLGFLDLFFTAPSESPVIIIGDKLGRDYLSSMFPNRPFYYLSRPVDWTQLVDTIKLCAGAVKKTDKVLQIEKELDRAEQEIEELHKIGMALSSEKDPVGLLQLILTKSRCIAQADAGSLYLSEGNTGLRFKLSQNSSLNWQVNEDLLLPINDRSIVGAVALSGAPINLLDAYEISPNVTFSFNRSFDEKSGYRSKSMIAVPMRNQAGETLGVIQLINKRSDFVGHKPGQPLKESCIVPFTRKELNLVSSLASQAAIALENTKLYQDIQNLFEGFVRAAIVAIEARDPTTCGHSERVAELTGRLAQGVGDLRSGPYAGIPFDSARLMELRYASLLHDFGKVGVREEVLIKAKKLFPPELEMLRNRFAYIRKSMEADYYRRSLEAVLEKGVDHYRALQAALEGNFKMQMDDVDDVLKFLVAANEPTILEEGNFHRLLDIAQKRYTDTNGQTTEYITERETHVLSIRKGSLSEAERIEIESHVTHTFNFLSKIPWTKNLKRVPEIAFAHHEKLNGRGYPNHLDGVTIPLESRLMTICDIYDALTARDRPYKRALPKEKALDIIYNETKQGLLDKALVDVFVEAQVYQIIENRPFRPPVI